MTEDRQRTFAEKLNHLFATVHPPSRGPYTPAEVAAATAEANDEGRGLSASAIQQLRNGSKKNPTMNTIRALAGFFGVPPTYFFDDEVAARTDAEIGILAAMGDAGVRQVALRARGLSTESLQIINAVIDQARRLDGLPGGAPDDDADPQR
ncbi:helix-turn-helix domain-containing protein [Streptomyces sp. Ru87]|uniref:helix-turn-helix domain-containing protein n=1 Tax=Streptomyces sp. Ru87 TaxID=2044307 RepID=UPI000BF95FAC|nr:helix-turn-helix domain-containing protein [Streptomyces sp. Ru87]PGH49701.1 Secondary metabolite protein [Streptomyces sp. Ru87]